MSIKALPEKTVTAIGSSQVLTDPASVVKELVDNSLDARATAIFVEIAVNTLDVIQVRDNGHGIAPEDRQLVARRYCTSKIRDFADLKGVGSKWLGFRGEALASAADMSGGLSVVTRVEGEDVAVGLKIGQDGRIAGQERASHPVGTTIRITDFFKPQSVRKQVALKSSVKCLVKIKRTLQAYALARPTIRFSLRVLKAKNDKGNWIYAPKPGAGVEDAAFKVVGKDCASQCRWSILESAGFEVQAFLPKPDADCARISNIGHFLSIDSRPVSTTRGVLKQVITLFKENLRGVSPHLQNAKDPFICINIVCPPESYDPNVEPAKDDVMFEDSSLVLAAAEKLFSTVYVPTTIEQAATEAQVGRHEAGHFSVGPDIARSYDDEITESDFPRKKRRTFRSNMYGCDEEDIELLTGEPPTLFEEHLDTEQEARDTTLSNPWVMAKMNTPIKTTAASYTRQSTASQDHARAEPVSSSPSKPNSQPHYPAQMLLTPQTSSPAPRLPAVNVPQHDARVIGTHQRLPPHQAFITPTGATHSEDDEATFLATRQSARQPSYVRNLPRSVSETVDDDSVPTRTLALGTPLHLIPDASGKPRRSLPRKQQQQQNINKPFVPPVHNPEVVWFQNTPSSFESPGEYRSRRNPAVGRRTVAGNGLVLQGEPDELLWAPRPLTPPNHNRDIRDFVAAGEFQAPTLKTRRQPCSDESTELPQELPEPRPRSHGTRDFVAASKLLNLENDESENLSAPKDSVQRLRPRTTDGSALAEVTGNGPPLVDRADNKATAISPRPRRSRTTDAAHENLHRSKSSRLPLERVPAQSRTQNVILARSTSRAAVLQEVQRFYLSDVHRVAWNEEPHGAYVTFGQPPTNDELAAWTERLASQLITMFPEGEMVGHLGFELRRAFLAQDIASLTASTV
ncbi:hypothetical protein BJ546DRAFT_329035 [Cryomyces antarcticus]|nr:hypothetical protein LTR60_002326 [Cryomyces antarcticus]